MKPETIDKVRELAADGLTVQQIQAELARKPVTVSTSTEQVAKDAAVLAWEQSAAAEIAAFLGVVTGNDADAVARIRNLETPQVIAAVRSAKGVGAAQRESIVDKSDAMVLLYLDARRKGYPWPLPDHFGQSTYPQTVTTRTEGQSFAESVGDDVPTLHQIREVLP